MLSAAADKPAGGVSGNDEAKGMNDTLDYKVNTVDARPPQKTLIKRIRGVLHPYRSAAKALTNRAKRSLGYDFEQWARVVMYQELRAAVEALGPAQLDALEISGGTYWQQVGFKSYSAVDYPQFDICEDRLSETFDVIIADQVFEHLLWPYRAGRNVYSMLKNDGVFIITTPFMIRVHGNPVDCSRWTETGLKHLLAECGFALDNIKTGSWGNRACIKANLHPTNWAQRGWVASLRNDPLFPVSVWAIAKRAE
jgi:SAM-dependent methyltransferase